MLKKFHTIFDHDIIINTSAIATAEECFPNDDETSDVYVKIKLITGDTIEIIGTLDDLIC